MKTFNELFYYSFLAIFIYHVIYFIFRYHVFKRQELLYYSLFLLSVSVYYLLYYHSKSFIQLQFNTSYQTFQSGIQVSLSLLQIVFYIQFIVVYLNLTKANKEIFKFLNFYKYYNLVFVVLCLSLGFMNINPKFLLSIISILAMPLMFTMLYFLRKLYSTYANIVILGTAFNLAGTLVSLCMSNYEMYAQVNLPMNHHIPAQIGLLLDLFTLGYGLSLKAAETDKKLVQYLLENEKLVANERSRLARDLHDGLGGMLSGIKLSLSSIKGNVVLKEKDALLFSNSITQLDSAIGEMRRVAHNMMPEALINLGLPEAINGLCDSINEIGQLKVYFEKLNFDERINKEQEIICYRMVQELLNNCIKHAESKYIIVQLSRNKNIISLTVEDDGVGFDIKQNRSGSGLQNIKSRVECIKGSMNIKSAPDKGTSVMIEFEAA